MSEEEAILTKKEVKDFTLRLNSGYFYWFIVLSDNEAYQIIYRIEPHITPRGNKSKRKIYFIRKNNKEFIFNEEAKKWFYSFRVPYIKGGI